MATILRVDGGAAFTTATGTTSAPITVTMGVANRLILVFAGNGLTSATATISDTAGHTWTALRAKFTQAASGAAYAWWALANGTGATTITVDWSTNSAGFIGQLVDVFSGNDTSAPISASNDAVGGSGTISGTVTPAHADCLLWGVGFDNVTGVGSGFTKGSDDTQGDWSEFKSLTGGSGAAQTVNFTNTSSAWMLAMAAIKPGVSADVTVDATISTASARGMRALVFPTPSIGYVFYVDGDGVFGYSKTTDGGATWGAQIDVDGAGAATVVAFDVWFDQWTPNDTGTLIHCWWFDVTNDIVRWRTLNISGDTLGTVRTVFTGASAVAGRGAFVSGTKTRSGYLYCAYDIDAGTERGFHRSTDSGTTWSANLATTFVEATLDTCKLFPASGTGDDNDCWALYYDASATALTLKLWDSSAVAQVESATIQTHTDGATDLTGQFGYDGAVRHTDGHLIVAAQSTRDVAAGTHQVFDCTSTSTITTKTAIAASTDDHYYPQVFINQGTGTIFVAYNGKRDGSEVFDNATKVYYTYSLDGGATWNAGDATYQDGAAVPVQQVWTPMSGSRFYAVWRVTGTLLGNYANSLIQLGAQGVTIASGAVLYTPTVDQTTTSQAVTAATLTSTATVNGPTVAPGAVTVSGATIPAAATLAAPAVVADQAVALVPLASGAVLYTPTVDQATTPQVVTGATLTSTATLTAPTVAPGAVTVTGATRATTTQIFAPTVVPQAVTISGATLAPTSQVFAPALQAVAFGATIPSGSGVFPPKLALTVSTTTRGTTAQLFTPTVTTGAVTVSGATVAATSVAQPPTVAPGAVTVTGATRASTALLRTPTITVGAVTVVGVTRGSSAQIFAPSVIVSVSVAGATIAATSVLFAPGEVSAIEPLLASGTPFMWLM